MPMIGLTPACLGLLAEVVGAEHVAVVGHRQRRHLHAGRPRRTGRRAGPRRRAWSTRCARAGARTSRSASVNCLLGRKDQGAPNTPESRDRPGVSGRWARVDMLGNLENIAGKMSSKTTRRILTDRPDTLVESEVRTPPQAHVGRTLLVAAAVGELHLGEPVTGVEPSGAEVALERPQLEAVGAQPLGVGHQGGTMPCPVRDGRT